jgi:hypothetical protein
VAPIEDDIPQVIDRIRAQCRQPALRPRENLHPSRDVDYGWSKQWIGIGGAQHPKHVGLRCFHLIGALIRQPTNGQRDRSNRSRHLTRVRGNRSGRHQRLERPVDLLTVGLCRQSRTPQCLGDGLRGLVGWTECQVREELGYEFTPFEPAERANGSYLSEGVLRARKLREQTKIFHLLCPKSVNAWGVKVVGQRDARVFRCQDRRLGRRSIRTHNGGRQLNRSCGAFNLQARNQHDGSRSRARHLCLPEYSSICVVRSSG